MRLTFDPANPAGAHVLLFYKQHEVDRFLPGDRYLKRLVRPIYNRLHRGRKVNGFGVSFELLCRAMSDAGYVVHRNDYALARDNPHYPVGLVGVPALLEGWRLPNPAILGPSIYDQPGLAPRLFDDPRFRAYVCLADWMYDMFEPTYRGRCFKWFAGIDTEAWPDLSGESKDLDFLIYDKVLWDYDRRRRDLIDPILAELDARGLTYDTVRYGEHDHTTYRRLLARSRSLLFLSDHETQGIAYQEAMSSGLPVLAWNQGAWSDPSWREHFDTQPHASSVPFFSDVCGETFTDLGEFSATLETFLARRTSYAPREYVIRNLGFARSAEIYATAYFAPLTEQAAGVSARLLGRAA